MNLSRFDPPPAPQEPDVPARPEIQLPVWQEGQPVPVINAPEGELVKLARVCDRWWDLVQNWLGWPLRQLDVSQAPLAIVNLLAWQRDLERYPAEPDWLWRLRVKHAQANARDAGSRIGFQRIWQRLGLGYLEQQERIPGQDWDVVLLTVSETLISQRAELLDILIRSYGRTCRRYQLLTISKIDLPVFCAEFNSDNQLVIARHDVPVTIRQRGFFYYHATDSTVAT